MTLIVFSIVVIIIAGISVILGYQARSIALGLAINGTERLAEQQSTYWKARMEGYLRVAQTVASIISDYEKIAPEERRERYIEIMDSVCEHEPNMVAFSTVFRANELDGLDARYAGDPRFPPNGQFAVTIDQSGDSTVVRVLLPA